tara:strand:- start:10988 stop:11896 length:909 start_codon:yes stop_codon:yes gene_type:complete
MTDFLIEDPVINNQTWAVVSLITPKLVKNCDKFLLKIKGIYSSSARANDEANKFHKKEKDFPIFAIEVGKWIAYKDDFKEGDDLNDELNELMKLYLDERKVANENHEKRKANYDDTTFISPKEEKDDVLKSEVIIESGKKIDYLKEDDVTDQKYYCISFLTPDQLEKENNLEIRGFKVRGMYNNEEEAKDRCKSLYNVESTINTYVGNIGHWVAWEDNSDNADDFEYANDELNNLMKAHKENQEKVKMFNSSENSELKNNDEKDNLLNEILDESLDNTSLNTELDEAKKKYEMMLNEESNNL